MANNTEANTFCAFIATIIRCISNYSSAALLLDSLAELNQDNTNG